MTYEAFDVVVVPFPFTDRTAAKRRPALVLSDRTVFNAPSGHAILAMISSKGTAPRPLDVPVSGLDEAGLSVASVVRFKLFTLDQRLILRRAGHLDERDRRAVKMALALLLHAN